MESSRQPKINNRQKMDVSSLSLDKDDLRRFFGHSIVQGSSSSQNNFSSHHHLAWMSVPTTNFPMYFHPMVMALMISTNPTGLPMWSGSK